MLPDPHFWSRRRVCVTGGTGFLGWNLVQRLLPLAAHVRILGLPPKASELSEQLKDLDCIYADVRDAAAVRWAVSDCDVVFHTAGNVAMSGPGLKTMHDIHLEGTRRVLESLPAHARLVHTSSVVAIGATRRQTVLNEDSPFNLGNLKVDYVQVKKAAEDLALAAAAEGRDVVVVNPGYLIGPNDYERSVMGQFCRRYWKEKVPLVPPGGWNLADVRDVARGHVLAAQGGRSGRRYILGGENVTLKKFVRALVRIRSMMPRWIFSMPKWLYTLVGVYAELMARLRSEEPYPSMQHVRVNRHYWFYTSERARTELGYQTRPLDATLRDMHDWFLQFGHVRIPRHLRGEAAATHQAA